MSDTEEEAPFASADEGDGVDKGTGAVKKDIQPPGGVKNQREKNVGKAGNGGTDKKDTAVTQSKKDLQKGKDKQQSQAKTAGKGDGQTVQKVAGIKTNPGTRKPAKETKKSPGATSSEKSVESREVLKPEVKQSEATKDKDSLEAAADVVTSQKDVEKADRRSELSTVERVEVTPETKQGVSTPERVQEDHVAAQDENVVTSGDIRTKLESLSSPGGQNIPRGQRDHTPEQEEILTKLGSPTEKSAGGGWGWGNWGSSLLSAATNSVQTFTHQVGDGFSTIMESVESSFGVPNPEEMAKAEDVTEQAPSAEEQTTVTSQPDPGQQEEKARASEVLNPEESEAYIEDKVTDGDGKKLAEEEKGKRRKEATAGGGEGWFSGWNVADLARKVQDTGKSLASKGQTLMSEGFDAVENLAAGGIDVLESIGKKTYDTLSEHDPAFRKTREFLSSKGNKPNLSSVLREAKDKAEYETNLARENEEARKAHFGTLFDDYQGIAHLEALEMLSNQSEKKVHSLLNALATSDLAKIKPTLISIKEAFEVSEEDNASTDTPKEQDFSSLVSQCVSELELGTAPDKLNKVHDMVKNWIVDFDSHESHESDSIKEVHQRSIQALAELTAKGVEQFHKAGELVLLEREKDKDCTERAHSLARLTGVLCHEIDNLASKFAEILNKMAGKDDNLDEVTPLVTNVYLEATNSSTYIQDAFQLLLPVLQHAALEHSILSRQS